MLWACLSWVLRSFDVHFSIGCIAVGYDNQNGFVVKGDHSGKKALIEQDTFIWWELWCLNWQYNKYYYCLRCSTLYLGTSVWHQFFFWAATRYTLVDSAKYGGIWCPFFLYSPDIGSITFFRKMISIWHFTGSHALGQFALVFERTHRAPHRPRSKLFAFYIF
jgi:hypothetical protein